MAGERIDGNGVTTPANADLVQQRPIPPVKDADRPIADRIPLSVGGADIHRDDPSSAGINGDGRRAGDLRAERAGVDIDRAEGGVLRGDAQTNGAGKDGTQGAHKDKQPHFAFPSVRAAVTAARRGLCAPLRYSMIRHSGRLDSSCTPVNGT